MPLRELDVLAAFKRYCALGVFAVNLHKLGNVLQEKARKQCESREKPPKQIENTKKNSLPGGRCAQTRLK